MFKKVMVLLTSVIILVFAFDFFSFKNLKSLQSYTKLPSFQLTKPNKPSNPEATIILTGDIMLGRSVMKISLSKNDPSYPFEKVSDILKKTDIVFGNLENPIVLNCQFSDSGLKFCADPKMVDGLRYANINIVNLGNNHAKNYGEDGLKQTENFLSNSGIDYVGADNLVIKEINGTKFGFLGFDFVYDKPNDLNYQLIKSSKEKVDVLIVMVHWGTEYTSDPTNAQKLIANDLVSSGADVVVGGHPHVIQSIDSINGKPVFYSLGNFVFDQPWSEETKKGLVIRLIYNGKKLSKIEKLPVYMKGIAQPEWTN
ncbi:MAG: CapA family protein [Candidatus Woesebacteria bacterium]|nr:CapA family protein [Candidatus Woesebacteria bacterium]